MSLENSRRKQIMDVMSLNRVNVPKRYIKGWERCQEVDGIVPPGHVWLITGSYDFSSEIGTAVAFDKTAFMGRERVVVSLCEWLGGNRHVAEQVGGIGVRLGELAIEPDGVVSGQLGEYSVDCIMDEMSE